MTPEFQKIPRDKCEYLYHSDYDTLRRILMEFGALVNRTRRHFLAQDPPIKAMRVFNKLALKLTYLDQALLLSQNNKEEISKHYPQRKPRVVVNKIT